MARVGKSAGLVVSPGSTFSSEPAPRPVNGKWPGFTDRREAIFRAATKDLLDLGVPVHPYVTYPDAQIPPNVYANAYNGSVEVNDGMPLKPLRAILYHEAGHLHLA